MEAVAEQMRSNWFNKLTKNLISIFEMLSLKHFTPGVKHLFEIHEGVLLYQWF